MKHIRQISLDLTDRNVLRRNGFLEIGFLELFCTWYNNRDNISPTLERLDTILTNQICFNGYRDSRTKIC